MNDALTTHFMAPDHTNSSFSSMIQHFTTSSDISTIGKKFCAKMCPHIFFYKTLRTIVKRKYYYAHEMVICERRLQKSPFNKIVVFILFVHLRGFRNSYNFL